MGVLLVGVPTALVAAAALWMSDLLQRGPEAPAGQNPGNEQPQPPPGREKPPPNPPTAEWVLPAKSFRVDVTPTLFLQEKTLRLSPDGGTVGIRGSAGADDDERSMYYDLSTGRQIGVTGSRHGPGLLSAGGKTAAVEEWGEPRLLMRDVLTGKEAEVGRGLSAYTYSPDGHLLVTARGSTLTFRPWPTTAGAVREVDAGSPVLALSQVFLAGRRVAATQADESGVVVRVWDVAAGRSVAAHALNRPRDHPAFNQERLRVAEDGKAMVIRARNRTDEIWDLSVGKPVGWAPSPLESYHPVTGGRVCYTGFGGAALAPVDIASFIAVADLRTGNVVYRLRLPPGVEGPVVVYDSARDGKRFVGMAGILTQPVLYVWELPN